MKQVLRFCESERDWIRRTTARLAGIESPTPDKAAVDRCGAEIARELSAAGAAVRDVGQRACGNHIVAELAGSGPRILLLGHIDTVWPVGELARMPVAERDGRLFGPGVLDMKGGVAIGILALRALTSLPGPPPNAAFLLTSDEETGSEWSRSLIEGEASRSDAVLVLEPSLPGGALKTSRKGCGRFEMTVTGVTAHAGIEPEKGASAVLELCEQILGLEKLQDASRGTSLTVGLASGGTRPNVVPGEASAMIDARVFSAAEAERVSTALAGLTATRPRTAVRVTGGFDRPPLERTAAVGRLYDLARSIGRELGLDVSEGATGGASDGNFTSALGIPTLDGLGAIGDGAHAAHEHVVVDALAPRAALVACLIGELARGAGRREPAGPRT